MASLLQLKVFSLHFTLKPVCNNHYKSCGLLGTMILCPSSIVNCLFLAIFITTQYFLQYSTVQIMLTKVWCHIVFQHCFMQTEGVLNNTEKLGHL